MPTQLIRATEALAATQIVLDRQEAEAAERSRRTVAERRLAQDRLLTLRLEQIANAIRHATGRGERRAAVSVTPSTWQGERQEDVLHALHELDYQARVDGEPWSYVDDDGDLRHRTTLSYIIEW